MEDSEQSINEGKILGAKEIELLENTDLKNMNKYICKIIGQNSTLGTGFFCKIEYKNKLINVLITNHHIIGNDFLENAKFLKVYISEEYHIIKINVKSKIYSSPENKYDIMI